MSFNYSYNRVDSTATSAPAADDAKSDAAAGNASTAHSQLPGFRNPWYSPNLGQHKNQPGPPHSQPQLSLLGAKRQSFANQLPVTYENTGQQHSPLFVHPPPRADNPFNHYYTSQEVQLNNFPDRRMSAAVDGSLFNPYNNPFQTTANGTAQTTPQMLPPGMASGNLFLSFNGGAASAAARRSSVAVGAAQYPGNFMDNRFVKARMEDASPAASYYNTVQAPPSPKVVPKMMRVHNKSDLKPKNNSQPKYRRRSVNAIHISPANALSVYLTESFAMCQPQKFRYCKTSNPKRVLTKPSDPKYNNGCDNEDNDYILYVNDILGQEEGRKYVVLDLLGSGTFGQVVKCQNLANQSVVAVKVVKAKPAYLNQSLSEVKLLEFLNQNSRSGSFIRLLDTFMHREHLCLVFEILASNLYELIKQNQFHGLSMKLVKSLTRQLLDACGQLKNFQIIHCDLKPENILLCQPDKPDIKIIDFGSACFRRQTIYSYIQSRFYRSPEVILGLPYTESIDMWSLGCIVGELFLGLPMFPGSSEYNQLFKIIDMLGNPPRHMIDVGRNSLNYFIKTPAAEANEKPTYKLKTHEEYLEFVRVSKGKEDISKAELPNKNYFNHRLLKDIILNYKMPSRKMTQSMIDKEYRDRHLLVDFLSKVLNLNPLERLTPQEALKHPFVNDAALTDKSPLSNGSSVSSGTTSTESNQSINVDNRKLV